MSEMLSQDEIDALLNGGGVADKVSSKISDEELALASEISDVGMSVVADFLLPKINRNITIKVKDTRFADAETSGAMISHSLFGIDIAFSGSLSDNKIMLFKTDDTTIINDLCLGGDGKSLNTEEADLVDSTVFFEQIKEAIPDSVTALAQLIKSEVISKSINEFQLGDQNDNLRTYIENNEMVLVTYSLGIADVADSEVFELIPVSMVKNIASLLVSTPSVQEQPQIESKKENREPKKKAENKKQPVVIQPVKFPSFEDNDDTPTRDESVDFIMDVNLQISVELGKCKKTIKEILELNIGSVVELDSLAEDYVSVYVNGKLIARGEVVVVDENFGIRIMELYTNTQKSIMS